MKTKLLFCLIALMTIIVPVSASPTVKGNGKVVTQKISIASYDEISIVGPFEFEYEQTGGAPYLEVTVDENLLPYLHIRVDGEELEVGPKREENGRIAYVLRPTVLKIRSGSKELKELSCAGSVIWHAVTPLKGQKMEVEVAGNGSVSFGKKAAFRKIDASVAGSGRMEFADLHADKIDGSVAGNGVLSLAGSANRASLSVAGSGHIEARDCRAENAECSALGSGVIRIDVTDQLDASVLGSGRVYYRGNPSVSQSVMGSGLVKKE